MDGVRLRAFPNGLVGAGAVLILTACVVGVRAGNYEEEPAKEATAAFLDALIEDDYEAAYELVAAESKTTISSSEFIGAQEEVEARGDGIASYELSGPVAPVPNVDPNEALTVFTRLTFKDGTSNEVPFQVVKEDGVWRVFLTEE